MKLHSPDLKGTGTKVCLLNDQIVGSRGGFSSGSWVARPMTNIVYDSIGVTLSSNQFVLPAGSYHIKGHAVTEDGATIWGRIDPAEDDADWWGEFDTDRDFGSLVSTDTTLAQAALIVSTISDSLSALTASTEYFFRFKAMSIGGGGEITSNSDSFTTQAASGSAPPCRTRPRRSPRRGSAGRYRRGPWPGSSGRVGSSSSPEELQLDLGSRPTHPVDGADEGDLELDRPLRWDFDPNVVALERHCQRPVAQAVAVMPLGWNRN